MCAHFMICAVADPEIEKRGSPTTRRRHPGNCAYAHKIYTRSRGKANGEKGGAQALWPPLWIRHCNVYDMHIHVHVIHLI